MSDQKAAGYHTYQQNSICCPKAEWRVGQYCHQGKRMYCNMEGIAKRLENIVKSANYFFLSLFLFFSYFRKIWADIWVGWTSFAREGPHLKVLSHFCPFPPLFSFSSHRSDLYFEISPAARFFSPLPKLPLSWCRLGLFFQVQPFGERGLKTALLSVCWN